MQSFADASTGNSIYRIARPAMGGGDRVVVEPQAAAGDDRELKATAS